MEPNKSKLNKQIFVNIYKDYFGPVIRRLQIAAYYPPKDLKRKKIYIIYAVINLFFMFVLLGIGEAVSIFFSLRAGDIDKITNDALMFVTDCGQYCKFYILITKNERIQRMARSVNDESYQPQTKIEENLIRTNMKSARRTTMIYFTLAMTTIVIWLLYPLISQTKTEIFSIYVPFDTSYSPIYEIFYVIKSYSLILHPMANTSKDSIVVFLMAHICGQLDIIDDKLRKLKETALEKIKNGYPKNLSDTMNELLIESIQRHRLILSLNKEINDVYTFAILAQFTTSVLIICVILYQISVLSVTSMVFFSMINYLFCMMFQLIVYCWHGNEVMLKSSNLFRSVYNIDWPETSISFQKNMLFLMLNVKKPIKIYAGYFFEVSLESYMSILRSSWSYFAVLKNSRDNILED